MTEPCKPDDHDWTTCGWEGELPTFIECPCGSRMALVPVLVVPPEGKKKEGPFDADVP